MVKFASAVVAAVSLLSLGEAFDLHECSWFQNDYDNSGLLSSNTKYPMDTCFGRYDSTDDAGDIRSYKYTCEWNTYTNVSYLIRWTYNDTDCATDQWAGKVDNFYNFSSVDDWDPNDREWNCGTRDCGVSIKHYWVGNNNEGFDETNQCVGINKNVANYTMSLKMWNPKNCSHGSDIVLCSAGEDRVAVRDVYPSPEGCDSRPYTTYDSWTNIEGQCYTIACGADVNKSDPNAWYVKQPDETLFNTESRYVSVWDEGMVYALDVCGNAFSTSSDVYNELEEFTYSFTFECNDDETGVYLWYYAKHECKGTRYFGNYYTKDNSYFSCSGDKSFATLVTYSDGDLDCGEEMGVFGPHNYEDKLYATGRCHRGSEDGDSGSWLAICDNDNDDKIDTLKIWSWESEFCNGTFEYYSEQRTGCQGNQYIEVLCDKEHTLVGASARAFLSWTAAFITMGSIWSLMA